MLGKQLPCIGPHATGVRQKTQSVLISASPLPAKKRAVLPQTEIFLIFLFSTPCSGYFNNRSASDALGLTPCFSSILGANRTPNRRKNMVLACTASPALHS